MILTGRPPFVGDTAEKTRVLAARGQARRLLRPARRLRGRARAGRPVQALPRAPSATTVRPTPARSRAAVAASAGRGRGAGPPGRARPRAGRGGRGPARGRARAQRQKRRTQLAVAAGCSACWSSAASAGWRSGTRPRPAATTPTAWRASRWAAPSSSRRRPRRSTRRSWPRRTRPSSSGSRPRPPSPRPKVRSPGSAAPASRPGWARSVKSVRSGLARARRDARFWPPWRPPRARMPARSEVRSNHRAKLRLYRSAFEAAGLPAGGDPATLAAAVDAERPGLRAALLRRSIAGCLPPDSARPGRRSGQGDGRSRRPRPDPQGDPGGHRERFRGASPPGRPPWRRSAPGLGLAARRCPGSAQD